MKKLASRLTLLQRVFGRKLAVQASPQPVLANSKLAIPGTRAVRRSIVSLTQYHVLTHSNDPRCACSILWRLQMLPPAVFSDRLI